MYVCHYRVTYFKGPLILGSNEKLHLLDTNPELEKNR